MVQAICNPPLALFLVLLTLTFVIPTCYIRGKGEATLFLLSKPKYVKYIPYRPKVSIEGLKKV